jgi:hypothetical protein
MAATQSQAYPHDYLLHGVVGILGHVSLCTAYRVSFNQGGKLSKKKGYAEYMFLLFLGGGGGGGGGSSAFRARGRGS